MVGATSNVSRLRGEVHPPPFKRNSCSADPVPIAARHNYQRGATGSGPRRVIREQAAPPAHEGEGLGANAKRRRPSDSPMQPLGERSAVR
jgi:hypothetical protein